jgi:hypothetical protein
VKGRWIIVALALVAAAAFALSVQSGRWWSVGEIRIGPFGSRACFEDQCREAFVGGTARWLRMGIAAGASGLLSMFVLTMVAAGVASKRIPKLAAKSALTSVLTSLAVGALFIVQRPSIPGVVIERGFYLFAVAVVTGLVAILLVLRAKPLLKAT